MERNGYVDELQNSAGPLASQLLDTLGGLGGKAADAVDAVLPESMRGMLRGVQEASPSAVAAVTEKVSSSEKAGSSTAVKWVAGAACTFLLIRYRKSLRLAARKVSPPHCPLGMLLSFRLAGKVCREPNCRAAQRPPLSLFAATHTHAQAFSSIASHPDVAAAASAAAAAAAAAATSASQTLSDFNASPQMVKTRASIAAATSAAREGATAAAAAARESATAAAEALRPAVERRLAFAAATASEVAASAKEGVAAAHLAAKQAAEAASPHVKAALTAITPGAAAQKRVLELEAQIAAMTAAAAAAGKQEAGPAMNLAAKLEAVGTAAKMPAERVLGDEDGEEEEDVESSD